MAIFGWKIEFHYATMRVIIWYDRDIVKIFNFTNGMEEEVKNEAKEWIKANKKRIEKAKA